MRCLILAFGTVTMVALLGAHFRTALAQQPGTVRPVPACPISPQPAMEQIFHGDFATAKASIEKLKEHRCRGTAAQCGEAAKRQQDEINGEEFYNAKVMRELEIALGCIKP